MLTGIGWDGGGKGLLERERTGGWGRGFGEAGRWGKRKKGEEMRDRAG